MVANVVEALTLRFDGSELIADVERYECDADFAGSLILSWNATAAPDGYTPIGSGTAFLRDGVKARRFTQTSTPDQHPANEYGWCDSAHNGLMILIVVFPTGHGPSDLKALSPLPAIAKISNGRLIINWNLAAHEHEARWRLVARTLDENANFVRVLNAAASERRAHAPDRAVDASGPESKIDVAGATFERFRRQCEGIPKRDKKARREALYGWNGAARDYFAACINAYFTEDPHTKYTGSAGWAADWLRTVAVHYATVKEEAVALGVDFEQLKPNLLTFRDFQRAVAEREEVAARQLRDDFIRVGLPTLGFDEAFTKHARSEELPKKLWIPALVFTSILLAYFFVLTSRSMPLDQSRQDIANKLFALLAGFAVLFLGGTALFALEFPKHKTWRFAFSATAGTAVFAFTWSYAPYWFRTTSPPFEATQSHHENTEPRPQSETIRVPSDHSGGSSKISIADLLNVVFDGDAPAAKPQDERPKMQVDLFSYNQLSPGKLHVVIDGDQLHGGDNPDLLIMAVRAISKGWLYVFQIDARGKVDWIYPQNERRNFSSGQNPLSAGRTVQMPPPQWRSGFKLDQSTGTEYVYIVFSIAPWPELEHALRICADEAPGTREDEPTSLANMEFSGRRLRGIEGAVPLDPLSLERAKQYIQIENGGTPIAVPMSDVVGGTGPVAVVGRSFRHVTEPSRQ